MTFPTLSHLIENITGVFIPLPIQTFGFFIVLSFIFGHHFIRIEFKRLEGLGVLKEAIVSSKKSFFLNFFEFIFNGLMSFIFGYKILFIINNYRLFADAPQKILLSSEGSIYLGISFLLIYIYINLNNKKKEVIKTKKVLPSDISWNFIFVAAISGIIGAKLFAVLEDIEYLLYDPLGAFFSFSGLTFYGGLILGTICVIAYGKKYKINILRLADTFAPSLILAYGIGRLGCHFSGDGDWGIITNMNNKPFFVPDWFWGYSFPHNVIEEGVRIPGCIGKYCNELPYLVYPTSLYEALFGILAFLILIKIRPKISQPGILFSIYLIFNGCERFLIEIIRVTDKYMILGLNITQAQLIGLIIILLGSSFLIYLHRTKNSTRYESITE